MTDARWMARIRPDIRGYPLLDRETWYAVLSSDDLGSIVDLWGKQVFIFARDAEYKLDETAGGKTWSDHSLLFLQHLVHEPDGDRPFPDREATRLTFPPRKSPTAKRQEVAA